MPGKNRRELTEEQKKYLKDSGKLEPKRSVVKNCIKAFIAGGIICSIGQALMLFFKTYFEFDDVTAGNPTIAVLIIISVILTGIGVYDHISQWAGAGSAVPITGFANTVSSAAIEHRSEGLVLGVGGNMFKLAGPVIAYGVVSAFFVAIVKIIIESLGVI